MSRKKTGNETGASPRTPKGSEALPDLPTENVAQFIRRMNRDYDLFCTRRTARRGDQKSRATI